MVVAAGASLRYTLGMRVTSALSVLLLAACSTPQPLRGPSDPDPFVGGVRQKPLTASEVRKIVQRYQGQIDGCFYRERLNSARVSGYVFELDIPNEGTRQTVRRRSATIEGQRLLEECLTHALQSISFPAHVGSRLRVELPLDPAPQ